MERIKQKPSLRETIGRKAKELPVDAVGRGKDLAIRRFREQVKDAAEGGQRQEEGHEEAIITDAAGTVRYVSRTLAQKHGQEKAVHDRHDIPECGESVDPIQPEWAQGLVETERHVSPARASRTEQPVQSPSQNVPDIKTKDRYIRGHASLAETEPETVVQASEQGRTLAVKRAEQMQQRRITGTRELPEGMDSVPETYQSTVGRRVPAGRTNSVAPERYASRTGRWGGNAVPAFREKRTFLRNERKGTTPSERKLLRMKRKMTKQYMKALMDGTLFPAEYWNQEPLRQSAVVAKQSRRQAVQAAARRTVSGLRQAVSGTVQAVRGTARAGESLLATLAAGGGAVVAMVIVVVLLGCLMLFGGGGNAVQAQPVSAEVLAYEPTIRLYAAQYGIPEYVELLMAVMMQESGGRGLDPMQAAEGGYNTRYPRVPNGITDPDYSIQCGVQELRDALHRAGVEHPMDMDHIKLALQGYNFGPGYVSWAVYHYGGYSPANAAEYSDMMAGMLGWRRYGDKEYVPHVLRYYAFSQIPTGFGNGAIVQIALAQEGNDGTIYWSWFGHTSRVAWCSEFASWCAYHAGLVDAGMAPKVSVCTDGVAWFRERGRFVDSSYVPAPGDFIYFDWEQDGHTDHVGIVEYVADGRVHTVEGNSGDRVRRSSYVMGSRVIFGFGVVG